MSGLSDGYDIQDTGLVGRASEGATLTFCNSTIKLTVQLGIGHSIGIIGSSYQAKSTTV